MGDDDRAGSRPAALLVEGTCDELGRRCCWVTLSADGPQLLTLACLPADLERPSDLAERLPKALIHRNVPGERGARAVRRAGPLLGDGGPVRAFGPRARWVETVALLAAPAGRSGTAGSVGASAN